MRILYVCDALAIYGGVERVLIDKSNGADQIIELLNSPEKLNEMKENCKKLALPNAAEDIFKLAKKLCDHHRHRYEDASLDDYVQLERMLQLAFHNSFLDVIVQ